jgi:hypothetical protein
MALPLSTAKMTNRRKKQSGKVVSEYGAKASPASKSTRSGASGRYKKGKK